MGEWGNEFSQTCFASCSNLYFEWLDVAEVNMSISECVYKITRLGGGSLGW